MRGRAGRRGFTLIEVLIVLVLLGLVAGSLFSVLGDVQRDYQRQRDMNRAQEMVRAAEVSIRTVLRSAGADPYQTGAALLDPDPRGTGQYDNIRILSDFNPPDGEFDGVLEDVEFWLESDTVYVRWQTGASPQALAYPVDDLSFAYFDRDGDPLLGSVDDATMVEFTIVVDRGPRTGTPDTFTGRVLLRNRL